jgi:hypothetical protein
MLTEQKLKEAPKFSTQQDWDWSNRNRTQEVMHYWGP